MGHAHACPIARGEEVECSSSSSPFVSSRLALKRSARARR
ncbi:hypothetical protein A7982_12157 [Minicystis rosea]|nr:hypothetical protein A7982_12157 [Minicystis rosea]